MQREKRADALNNIKYIIFLIILTRLQKIHFHFLLYAVFIPLPLTLSSSYLSAHFTSTRAHDAPCLSSVSRPLLRSAPSLFPSLSSSIFSPSRPRCVLLHSSRLPTVRRFLIALLPSHSKAVFSSFLCLFRSLVHFAKRIFSAPSSRSLGALLVSAYSGHRQNVENAIYFVSFSSCDFSFSSLGPCCRSARSCPAVLACSRPISAQAPARKCLFGSSGARAGGIFHISQIFINK